MEEFVKDLYTYTGIWIFNLRNLSNIITFYTLSQILNTVKID